jgi:hypothetical protein
MNELNTGEKIGISVSILYLLLFALSYSLLQSLWNQGTAGTSIKEQQSLTGQTTPPDEDSYL